MTPRALRTLVTIAELGSFRHTAETLGLTVSAVSMQMKALEAELGVELFDRSTRPPGLTPLGRRAAGSAREVVAAERALRALCAKGAEGPEALAGDWRIGFVPTTAVRILPGFLRRAAEMAPAARFAVETALSEPLAQTVARGLVDAAVITRSETMPEALTLTHLATEELVWALPPGAEGLSPADCMERFAFLQFTPETGIGRLVAAHLESEGLVPGARIVLDGIEAILDCVAAGVGFTALPRPDAERYAAPGVSLLAMADPPLTRDVVLATLSGSAGDCARLRLAELAWPGASDGPGSSVAAPGKAV